MKSVLVFASALKIRFNWIAPSEVRQSLSREKEENSVKGWKNSTTSKCEHYSKLFLLWKQIFSKCRQGALKREWERERESLWESEWERKRENGKNCCKNKWSMHSFVGIHGCEPNFTIFFSFVFLFQPTYHFVPRSLHLSVLPLQPGLGFELKTDTYT